MYYTMGKHTHLPSLASNISRVLVFYNLMLKAAVYFTLSTSNCREGCNER